MLDTVIILTMDERNVNQQKILAILKRVGAIIVDSHIVYTSGRHGSAYINKDALYPHTEETSKICKMMAEKFKDMDIEVVAAPALGGIILSQWVAYHLSKLRGEEVVGVYTEKTPDKRQIFTRGYDKFVKRKKVLVVEDITTTGDSVRKTIDSVRRACGRVAAVSVIVNRNPEVTTAIVGAPFYPLATIEMQAWDKKDCKLCKKNIPINTIVGKGREYLAKQKSKQ